MSSFLFIERKISTAYEYLERRFNVLIRLIVVSVLSFIKLEEWALYFFLPSIALNLVTDMNIYVCISLMWDKFNLYFKGGRGSYLD